MTWRLSLGLELVDFRWWSYCWPCSRSRMRSAGRGESEVGLYWSTNNNTSHQKTVRPVSMVSDELYQVAIYMLSYKINNIFLLISYIWIWKNKKSPWRLSVYTYGHTHWVSTYRHTHTECTLTDTHTYKLSVHLRTHWVYTYRHTHTECTLTDTHTECTLTDTHWVYTYRHTHCV